MKIGIIGAGKIGGTLARLFAQAGHDVAISNSRGPDTLGDLVEEIDHGVRAMTARDAAAFGELVVVSVPLHAYRDIPVQQTAGKIVVDTNNYYPSRDGQIPELDDDRTTSSELLQAHLPDAPVVKAFNAIMWKHLGSDGRPPSDPERLGIPISGDDEHAKRMVSELIDQIGFEAIDAGTLADGGRRHQPGAPGYTMGTRTPELRSLLGV
jgi:8-hydroxy-5-deazaflavin:NADPH oxidoreductase